MKGISITNSLQETGKIILLKEKSAEEVVREEYKKAMSDTKNLSKEFSYLDPEGKWAQVTDKTMTNITEIRLCEVC